MKTLKHGRHGRHGRLSNIMRMLCHNFIQSSTENKIYHCKSNVILSRI